jgi:hypothetical protein
MSSETQMDEPYRSVASMAWVAGTTLIVILLVLSTSASTSSIDGSLRGGIVALTCLLLVCHVFVAGRVLMRASWLPSTADGPRP